MGLLTCRHTNTAVFSSLLAAWLSQAVEDVCCSLRAMRALGALALNNTLSMSRLDNPKILGASRHSRQAGQYNCVWRGLTCAKLQSCGGAAVSNTPATS